MPNVGTIYQSIKTNLYSTYSTIKDWFITDSGGKKQDSSWPPTAGPFTFSGCYDDKQPIDIINTIL